MWSIPATHPTTVSHSGHVTMVMKPPRSHRHHLNLSSPTTFSGEIFRQPHLRPTNPPSRSSSLDLHVERNPHIKQCSTSRHTRELPSATVTTCRCVGGAWECVANFPTTPFSHQERPASTSFSSPLVSLFEACIYTFSAVLCPVIVLF